MDTDVDTQLGYVKQVLMSRPNLERLADVAGADSRVRTSDDKQRMIDSIKDRIDIVDTAAGFDPAHPSAWIAEEMRRSVLLKRHCIP